MAKIGRVEFDGTSAEAKPTAMPGGTDLPAGSKFVETDTGQEFWWAGAWLPLPAVGTALRFLLTEANELLAEIRLETLATRLALQEFVNEGSATQHDFRELAQTIIDRSETEEP